jgi:hypothetical protein
MNFQNIIFHKLSPCRILDGHGDISANALDCATVSRITFEHKLEVETVLLRHD